VTTLVPILGDQLSFDISSLDGADAATTIVLMMEVVEEATYVAHHRRKIAYIFSAMRHHAEALRAHGWHVDYVALDDAGNAGSFTGEVVRAAERHKAERITVTEAGEWRVQAMLESWETITGLPTEIRRDKRFLASKAAFGKWMEGRTTPRLEHFYREMRRASGILVEDGKPTGGQWNYDKDNRKGLSGRPDVHLPPHFAPDAITKDVLALVEARFGDHVGNLDNFGFAVTAEQAAEAEAWFLDHALPYFGDHQDAMVTGEPILWHAHLSPYINSGLIDPVALCRKVAERYEKGWVALNSAEGFIRQIIGWREYVRGIYWWAGPDYVDRNFLEAERDLPGWYWTGETDMHCLAQAIGQTLELAYAHHIQRLMVTGNFAMLIGADPKQVHRWYLEVYADAYEWVELPNTLGMSQFADRGLMGSKPYASGGAYINRMSDYCGHCRYDVTKRTGENACPFNALYWDFLDRNRKKLGNNNRLAMPYRTWDKFAEDERVAVRAQAADFLSKLDAEPSGY